MSDVTIESSWREPLADLFRDPFFADLTQFIRSEYSHHRINPPGSLIFNAFNLCPFPSVRVVIIGQDPYHNPGQAHGLSFSVPEGVPFPPSLRNIFREIESDTGNTPYRSGDLSRWAQQGVLLLNAILTVRENSPGSHQNRGWERFTDSVIEVISERHNNVVFMLWGRYAIDKGKSIDSSRHLILTAPHPSPLSASRGFFGSRHFSSCNSYLTSKGRKPVDWR